MTTSLENFDPVVAVADSTRVPSAIESIEDLKAPPSLTVGEVARMFDVSENTVARWADRGILAHYRNPAGHRRILRDAAIAMRKAQLEKAFGWPTGGAVPEDCPSPTPSERSGPITVVVPKAVE